ncbi:MAG: glycosyltransferase [Chloroflexi bacterium]|nr:glycosyltransferase [Chloroflexota bacterium]
MTPLITLSIVSHGDSDKIPRLLASLQACEPELSRFQIILTDNLQNDLPEFNTTPWESLRLVRNKKKLGFAQNHNRAFELARGQYFAILNPDLIFEKPVLSSLLNMLDAHNADLIAPQIVDEMGVIQDSYRPLPTPIELIQRRMPGYTFQPPLPDADGMIRPDWIAGMFWLWRSDSYRRLGGMDRRFRLYFEDVDMCTRARLRGMTIMVAPQVQVRHDARRSSRSSFYYLFLHAQSAMRFFLSSEYRSARRSA